MNNKHSRVCVTVNLPDGKSWEDYDLHFLRVALNADYIVMGKETGAEGRKHFQGYFEFSKRKSGKAIDNIFRRVWPLPISVHFEPARGTQQQNTEYCSKSDTEPFTYGTPTGNEGQGTRMDAHAAMIRIKQGATLKQMAEEAPGLFFQYGRAMQTAIDLFKEHRAEEKQLIFLWGPTGTGKTCHARKELDPEPMMWSSGGFMNGYSGDNDAVLFDDFDWAKMDYKFWLQMTDRYSMTVNIKGGFKKWTPKTIIFTSNDNPKDWWPEIPAASREAIHRRMDEFGEIRHLGTLVPHTQNILQKFLRRPAAQPEQQPAAIQEIETDDEEEGGAPAPQPSPQIIDLTGDSDEVVRSTSTGKIIFARKTTHSYDINDYEDDTEDDDDSRGGGGKRLRRSETMCD